MFKGKQCDFKIALNIKDQTLTVTDQMKVISTRFQIFTDVALNQTNRAFWCILVIGGAEVNITLLDRWKSVICTHFWLLISLFYSDVFCGFLLCTNVGRVPRIGSMKGDSTPTSFNHQGNVIQCT